MLANSRRFFAPHTSFLRISFFQSRLHMTRDFEFPMHQVPDFYESIKGQPSIFSTAPDQFIGRCGIKNDPNHGQCGCQCQGDESWLIDRHQSHLSHYGEAASEIDQGRHVRVSQNLFVRSLLVLNPFSGVRPLPLFGSTWVTALGPAYLKDREICFVGGTDTHRRPRWIPRVYRTHIARDTKGAIATTPAAFGDDGLQAGTGEVNLHLSHPLPL